MAAEKLTKARLTHIMLMMIILAVAFTWRTIEHHHDQIEQSQVLCQIDHICDIQIDAEKYQLLFQAKQFVVQHVNHHHDEQAHAHFAKVNIEYQKKLYSLGQTIATNDLAIGKSTQIIIAVHHMQKTQTDIIEVTVKP